MESEQIALTDYAAELRLTFDLAFAAAPADSSEGTERFLAIEVGGDYYALRLMEISGLFADKEVVPLPSRSSNLLGIASFRGVVVPVYDLRILLGYAAGPKPRWLALITPDTPVGLAFDQLGGYLDLAPEAITREVEQEYARQHIVETIRDGDMIRSVIGATSILEAIKRGGN